MYKPQFRLTPHLLDLSGQIGALRSWLEQAPLRVSWLPVLQNEARNRAVHSSTSIEGNPLTLSQVKAITRGEKIGAPAVYEKEVSNYWQAVRWVQNHVRETITEAAVLKLHGRLTQDILPVAKSGRYKQKQNYVVDEKGRKVYTPPPPAEAPGLVKELLDWLNSDESEKLPGFVVCAVLHHQLVSIHPFADGNGRLSRLLGSWVLYKKGLDTFHVFSPDDYFAADRRRYYQKIRQARELDYDLTYWIEYVTEGVVQTLKDVKKRVEQLQVKSRYQMALTPRQEELVRLLKDEPHQMMADLKKKLKLTRARINQIITPLVDSGLVIKEAQGRATRYRLNLT